jgi:hypothetical protein
MAKKNVIELIINEKHLALIKRRYNNVQIIMRNETYKEIIVITITLGNNYDQDEIYQSIYDLGYLSALDNYFLINKI